MDASLVQRLARPAVFGLVSLLAYGSQLLFRNTELFRPIAQQIYTFNALVLCIWICYWRACYTNPGGIPPDWAPDFAGVTNDGNGDSQVSRQRQRWCKKCRQLKPPRAHHCKTCQRCIPKMDHHCPWTFNCVSYTTFPHFLRFLFYAIMSMCQLQYFLVSLALAIWNNRDLPSYLGPSVAILVWLCILLLVNSITLFALGILLISSASSLCTNVTTIESWEIDRHRTLARRAKAFGGYLDGPDGTRIRIVKQEFPYDVGIWSNISQGMGAGFFTWFWPFAPTPSALGGLAFEVNGFEDPSTTWPPPDPDRISRRFAANPQEDAFAHEQPNLSDFARIREFQERQEQDWKRRQETDRTYRRRPFHQRFGGANGEHVREKSVAPLEVEFGEEAWRNSEGERLEDFGLDEDAEFYDEDSIPLSELLRRRKLQQSALSP